ncbi:hypothetical protein KASHIRA_00290 [Serratia phage vB_SmaM-Kashira]|nr:hypothetical protein KASHIRA_00290 [Serratia phage vB_SmaM-Kashira]
MAEFREKGSVLTYYASIHMAGSIEAAKDLIQLWVLRGACVQVTPCDYIYTGGREAGFVARMINYPRFPKEESEIFLEAEALGNHLATLLGQLSFTIERPGVTAYYEREGFSKQPEVKK